VRGVGCSGVARGEPRIRFDGSSCRACTNAGAPAAEAALLPSTSEPSRPAGTSLTSGEAELVARLRAGDESACEALFLAHFEALWRFAHGYVRSRAVAEEVVQEVFLQLWRDRAQAELRGSARAWLFAAVRNHALNHVRHERVVARLADRVAASAAVPDESPVAMGAPLGDVEGELEARDLDAVVERAIAALPERRRVAMSLRWNQGLSAPEIARVIGTTPEAVRVLLTRARTELAGLLGYVRK
jgi:RNA polymerase sigma-70 factor, ECF subfamily